MIQKKKWSMSVLVIGNQRAICKPYLSYVEKVVAFRKLFPKIQTSGRISFQEHKAVIKLNIFKLLLSGYFYLNSDSVCLLVCFYFYDVPLSMVRYFFNMAFTHYYI